MEWYYALNGQRQGPVTVDEFARLVAAGTITDTTLVWRQGMANWQPWREVAPTAGLPEVVPPALEASVGTAYPSAAAPLSPVVVPLGADAFAAKLQASGYAFSIGSCLSRAFGLYKRHFWPCFGVTLLAYLIIGVSANIPLLGFLAQFFVGPQVVAGLFWYFLRKVRQEHSEVGDLFAGYRRGFWHYALLALVQLAIALPLMLVILFSVGISIFLHNQAGGEMAAAPGVGAFIVIAIAGIATALVIYRLSLAHVIVLDRGETAWNGLRLSWRIMGMHFLALIGLAVVLVLISIAGMLALFVGVLFVLPLYPACMAYVYEDANRAVQGLPPAP